MDRPFHPSDADLVSLRDDELARNSAESVRRHLAYCVDCRERLTRYGEAISDYSGFQETVLKSATDEPSSWASIRHRVEARSGAALFWQRFAAAAIVLFGIASALYEFRKPKPPAAAELLQRSAAMERTPNRALILIAHGHSWLRPAVLHTTDRWRPEAERASYEHIQALFVEANYSWSDPLSARSFASWRARLPQKRDFVTEIRGERGQREYYRVRTETRNSTLHRTSLILRADTLRTVQGEFEFSGSESVQLSEAPATHTPPVLSAPSPIRRRAEVQHETESDATPADELRVLAALNRIGADSGEPITVERSRQHVVVGGLSVSAERMRAIAQALSGIPKVEIRSNESAPRGSARPLARYQIATQAGLDSPMRQLLEQRAGGAEPLQQIVDDALETCSTALAQAHSLSGLAKDFPPDVEREFSEADRQMLNRLVANHEKALARDMERLKQNLTPVLGAVTNESNPTFSARQWQGRAVFLLALVEKLDHRINEVFAGGNPSGSLDEVVNELRQEIVEIYLLSSAEGASANR